MTSRITLLAEKIASVAKAIETAAQARNSDAGADFVLHADAEGLPRDVEALRNSLLDATSELQDALLPPQEILRTYASHANLISLHFIHRFNIAKIVPVQGTISYSDIAKRCGGVPMADVRRLLRHATTIRVFEEPSEGVICHTEASRLLRDENYHNWIGATCEDSWPAATKTVDAIQLHPGSEEPTQSGFSLAHGEDKSLYDIVMASPARAKRFAGGMRAYSSGPAFEPELFVKSCADTLGALPAGSIFVDVGGAAGHVSHAVARGFPEVQCIVQDLPNVVSAGQAAGDKVAKEKAESLIKAMAQTNGDAQHNGDIQTNVDIQPNGEVHANGDINADSDVKANDVAHVNGITQANGDAHVNGNVHTNGVTHVNGNVHINGVTHVNGTSHLNGNSTTTATSTIKQNPSFQAHDFFQPQPIKNASVYYLRWILHNWGDKYAKAILRQLAAAMGPSSLLLIHDYCIESLASLPMPERRLVSAMDIGMLQLLNARERDEQQWRELIEDADPRLVFAGVRRFRGSALAVIEVRLKE